jgi:hypothetical protein
MPKFTPFWRGWSTAIILVCLYQDALGLERYIAVCRASWLNVPWPVWVIALIIVSALPNEENET